MNRLEFFQKTLLFLIGANVFSKPSIAHAEKNNTDQKLVLKGHIRGFKYYEGPRLLSSLHVGDPLQLVREPKNQHDPLAIAIYHNGSKLGYIGRERNEGIAMILDYNLKEVKASISNINLEADLWNCIEYSVFA